MGDNSFKIVYLPPEKSNGKYSLHVGETLFSLSVDLCPETYVCVGEQPGSRKIVSVVQNSETSARKMNPL